MRTRPWPHRLCGLLIGTRLDWPVGAGASAPDFLSRLSKKLNPSLTEYLLDYSSVSTAAATAVAAAAAAAALLKCPMMRHNHCRASHRS